MLGCQKSSFARLKLEQEQLVKQQQNILASWRTTIKNKTVITKTVTRKREHTPLNLGKHFFHIAINQTMGAFHLIQQSRKFRVQSN